MQSFNKPPSFAALFGSKTIERADSVGTQESQKGRAEQRLQKTKPIDSIDLPNERFSPQSDLARTLLDVQAAGIQLPQNTKEWVDHYFSTPEVALESRLSHEIQTFIESLQDP